MSTVSLNGEHDNTLHVIRNQDFPNVSTHDLATESMPRSAAPYRSQRQRVPRPHRSRPGHRQTELLPKPARPGISKKRSFTSTDVGCVTPSHVDIVDFDLDGNSDLGVVGVGIPGCLAVLFNQTK